MSSMALIKNKIDELAAPLIAVGKSPGDARLEVMKRYPEIRRMYVAAVNIDRDKDSHDLHAHKKRRLAAGV